ncbi:MAG: WD40 repeat domain-containing protein [Gaiellaceae bacterium]
MRDGDVGRLLASVPIPGELEARRRSWRVVRAGFEAREPVAPEPRSLLRPALVGAAALAVLAAALSPPGRAVLDEVRDAVGRNRVVGVESAQPSLFSLPAAGRVLVESARGPWIVRDDGTKRLLGRYREASWSPFGQFVVASRRNELVALEPDGDIRWSVARPDVRHPRWGGTRTDTRIAYISRDELHVVGGDSEGDRVLVRRVADVAPAWKPGGEHVLAYVAPSGAVRVVDSDSGHLLGGWRVAAPEQLAWSADGELVMTRSKRLLSLHTGRALRVRDLRPQPALTADARSKLASRSRRVFLDAAFAPAGRSLAAVQYDEGSRRSTVHLYGPGGREREIFSGGGRMTDVEWSPDGRWLLVAWQSADQWVFLRPADDDLGKLVARSSISKQLNRGAASAAFPAIAGWCCR